jgi:hypothetical protein
MDTGDNVYLLPFPLLLDGWFRLRSWLRLFLLLLRLSRFNSFNRFRLFLPLFRLRGFRGRRLNWLLNRSG